ncbi:MAG: CarD family transcriptional regulator [Lachnospiraceae bacterium]
MFETGQLIVYGGTGVCEVDGIETREVPGTQDKKLYYTLRPVYSKGSKIYTPVNNEKVVMRPLITKSEANTLINRIGDMDILQEENMNLRDKMYKKILYSCDAESCTRIIKTLYIRKNKRQSAGKRVTANDAKYIHLTEEFLFGELALAIGVPKDEIQNVVTNEVEKLCPVTSFDEESIS